MSSPPWPPAIPVCAVNILLIQFLLPHFSHIDYHYLDYYCLSQITPLYRQKYRSCHFCVNTLVVLFHCYHLKKTNSPAIFTTQFLPNYPPVSRNAAVAAGGVFALPLRGCVPSRGTHTPWRRSAFPSLPSTELISLQILALTSLPQQLPPPH